MHRTFMDCGSPNSISVDQLCNHWFTADVSEMYDALHLPTSLRIVFTRRHYAQAGC